MSNEQQGSQWQQDGLETRLRTVERLANGAFPLVGTVAGGNAVAGTVGEYAEASLVIGSAVSLTTNTDATVVSFSLTPGDWDVSAVCGFTPAASTSITHISAGVSTTAATMPTALGAQTAISFPAIVPGATTEWLWPVTPTRLNLTVTTTVYLIAHAFFTVSTLGAYGVIRARRVR
jgi:hypothetical protein